MFSPEVQVILETIDGLFHVAEFTRKAFWCTVLVLAEVYIDLSQAAYESGQWYRKKWETRWCHRWQVVQAVAVCTAEVISDVACIVGSDIYAWGRDVAVVAMTLNYVEVVVEDYRDAVKVLDAF